MFWMAEIGDKVEYEGVIHEVHDITIRNKQLSVPHKPSVATMHPLMSKGAVLEYLIMDIETDYGDDMPEKFWINADSVDPEEVPDTKRIRQPSVDMIADKDEFFEQDRESIHLQQLGKSMLGWLDGLESLPDNDKLPEIVTYLLAIQYDKEGFYGSSWKTRGEYRGIMPNIDRKYDRLDKITNDEIAGTRPKLPHSRELTTEQQELVGESKIDAIADLANYCLLYLTWMRENKPGAFKLWVDRNVPKYLSVNIPFIENYYR